MRRAAAVLLLACAPAALRAEERVPVAFSSATLTCDYMEFSSTDNVAVARGNAVLTSSGAVLEADELRMDMTARSLRASGRVRLTEEGVTILADEVDYHVDAGTGVFVNGFFTDPPYRLWARRMVRVSSDTYRMERAAMTSCPLDPPHYHVRMASLEYQLKKRASASWPRLALEDTAVLGFPYYSKTFRKKPWALTVDPGRSSYHGLYAKSVFSYRLTDHGTARAYWDHFTRSGEGLGGEYTYDAPEARGTAYGYRITDRLADSTRWNARAVHWQALSPRLSLEMNAMMQSDAGFNNLYFGDDLFRVRTENQSSAALNWRRDLYTARLSALHNRVFDPARGAFVTQRTVLPEISFQGAPWRLGRSAFLTVSAAGRRQYDRPTASPLDLNPLIPEKDRARYTGEAAASLRRPILLGRRATLEPSAGVSGVWQSWRDLGATRDPNASVQGRGFTGLALRHRVTRRFDYDVAHLYRVRWTPDQLKREHAAPDQGMEENRLAFIGSYRSPKTDARLSTGYDLRDPEGQPVLSPRQKVAPPVLDLSWRPARWTRLVYRQVHALFPARRAQSTQLSWTVDPARDVQWTSGFSYNSGLPGALQLRHGAAFQLTRGWRIEGALRYLLQGPGGLRYDAVPKERFEQEYVVRRDLHCWNMRVTYRKRPGNVEAYVRLDLKSQSAARRSLATAGESQYYPGREIEE